MSFLPIAKTVLGLGQLGLGAASLFGSSGPSRKSLGAFDIARANAPAGTLQVAETTPGLLSSHFIPSGEFAGLTGQLGDLRSDLRSVRSEVRPGFGRFTDAALRAVANARSRAKGDIKNQLARRRLLGSSFGADAITRSEREFAELENRTAAAATIQETALTARLIDQEFRSAISEIDVELRQLGLASNFASSLLAGANAAQGSFNKILQSEATGQGQGVAALFRSAESLLTNFDKIINPSGSPSDPSVLGFA